jgi:predicted RNase H-like HicB family nuclease
VLNYPVTIVACEEGGFVAAVEDLSGCMTQGETVEEVWRMIEDAVRLWIETAKRDGERVPPPRRFPCWAR